MILDFKGGYPYSVDDKNRVTIPARFRKILKDAGEEDLVITWGIVEPCIVIYPKTHYDRVTESLRTKVNHFKDNQRKFFRDWTRFAADCTMDNQGRINLSPELMKRANITSDVLIIGNVDKIQIWEPNTLDRIDSKNIPTAEDYNELGNELLF